MGFFNGKKREERIKLRKERQAYREILNIKLRKESRQAFAKESIKVAREKARKKARRKTIGEIAEAYAKKKISAPRRRVKRRTATRKISGGMSLYP